MHPTPAESAPITTKEPSLNTTTTSSDAIESSGGDLSTGKLHYPVCSQEESIAIAELVATCPSESRQKALDEIEGARQAGVIKTNLVPFARGIVMAIHRGTFTVGHGTNVVAQRQKKSTGQTVPICSEIKLDVETLEKGKAFISRLARV